MNLNILLVVSSSRCAHVFIPLLQALKRKKVSVAVFLTGSGAHLLNDQHVVDLIEHSKEAVVCSESWQQHSTEKKCPVSLGSQTDHSRLVGEASRVISL